MWRSRILCCRVGLQRGRRSSRLFFWGHICGGVVNYLVQSRMTKVVWRKGKVKTFDDDGVNCASSKKFVN